MWFLLFILSFVLVVALSPIGMIATLIKSLFLFNTGVLKNYFKNLAISLDQFGNVSMAGLFNEILIKSQIHKFGNPDETISSVLGKNKRDDMLTGPGKWIDGILNKIDKDHSIKSIEK